MSCATIKKASHTNTMCGVHLYTGEVNLAGLSLKRAALDGLDLPIDVKEGVYMYHVHLLPIATDLIARAHVSC